MFLAIGGQGCGRVWRRGLLCRFSKAGFRRGMGCMLWAFGGNVAEFMELVRNVLWHGDVQVSPEIIPGQLDPTVEAASPIGLYCIVDLERVDQMFGVLIANVLDAKVVDD